MKKYIEITIDGKLVKFKKDDLIKVLDELQEYRDWKWYKDNDIKPHNTRWEL